MAEQPRGRVAFGPDQTLQRLERRGLAIFGDPRMQVFENARIGRIGFARFGRGLTHRVLDGLVGAMLRNVRIEVRVGIRKEHVVHERDRRRRAFDVGNDRAGSDHS